MSDVTSHINYNKIVSYQLKKWREAREPLLKELDVQFFKAIETNNTNKIVEIAQQKNALRNITNYDFSQVENVNDIFDIWPEILGPKPE